ncbi:MAG: M3 family metallopeptidase [Deinococcaceae bacterium]
MPSYTHWSEFEPLCEALKGESLSPECMGDWLQRWNELECQFFESLSRITVQKDSDPTNTEYQTAFTEFVQTVVPAMEAAQQSLRSKLLSVANWTPPTEYAHFVHSQAHQAQMYHEANPVLEAEEYKLTLDFDRLMASLRVDWDGSTLTLQEAEQLLLDLPRMDREMLWTKMEQAHLGISAQLDDLFLKLLSLRRKIAKNSGFDRLLDYFWAAKERFDYTEHDAHRLHQAIEKQVLPVMQKAYSQKAQKMRLTALRPWDILVDAQGRSGLKPFNGHLELEETAQRIFNALDSEWGKQFADMRAGGHLDFESRPNKIPGLGYCTFFPITKQPFIYWTAVGMDVDVRVMMHEAGHAFHVLASSENGRPIWNLIPQLEFAEVISQSMELLTLGLLEKPIGFYSQEDAQRSRQEKLMTVLRQFVGNSAKDRFQLWLYGEAPEDVTIADIDAKWLACSENPSIDASGLEWARVKGWQFGHCFKAPLYMFEYIIAWVGALQVWQNAQSDQPKAIADLKYAMSLGKTRTLPELFEAAGIAFSFDESLLSKLMAFVSSQFESMAMEAETASQMP